MGNELRIPFENLLKRGIQREEFSMDQGKIAKAEKESVVQNYDFFFKDIYKQAFTLIDTICAESVKENSRNSIRKETHNVIAFTGRRGTGKTSAMLSIADSCVRREDKQFIALPFIDAAVLDDKEDIFPIVLSNMFKELDKKCENERRTYDFRQTNKFNSEVERLREEMCDIYDSYNLQHTSPSAKSNSSYNLMKRLSEHHSISERFTKLVNEYTEFFSKENKGESYLIICIDDIDMAQQKHIHIMQCIQQYFMIPNIIVLLTLNFTMLSAYLQKDFYEDMKTGIEDKDLHNLHLSFEHTNNYLQKIIPSDKRITMPSWKKYDYRALIPYYINLGKGDNLEDSKKKFDRLEGSVLFEKLREHSENDYTLSPKELILIMLANRTNIYLDVKGNKTHFMEPESLRDLYDKFHILYNMNNIRPLEPDKNNNYRTERNANRKILLDYLYFKMLPEYDFSYEEKHLIDEFLAEPIERRGRRIWEYYFKKLTSEEHRNRLIALYSEDMKVYGRGSNCDLYDKEKQRFQNGNYNLGEFFRIIYNGSRLGLLSSNLIKFILASYSFSMPLFVEKQIRRGYHFIPLSSQIVFDDVYKKLRMTFGNSLMGTWLEDIFENQQVEIIIDTQKVIKKLDEKVFDLKTVIHTLICLLLLSKCPDEPIEVINKNEKIEIRNQIDPTAFIINGIDICSFLLKLEFKYNDKLYEYSFENNKYSFSITRLIMDIFDREVLKKSIVLSTGDSEECLEKSIDAAIYEEMDKIREDNSIHWFLLKHTDVTYNIIKRAVSAIIYNNSNDVIQSKELNYSALRIIQVFLIKILSGLKEIDEFYFHKGNSFSNSKSIYDSFLHHQVFQIFYNSYYGEQGINDEGFNVSYLNDEQIINGEPTNGELL